MHTGFRYEPEDHSYWLDDRRLPSVTQVLSVLSNGYPAAVSAETLDHKRRLGQMVHRACELDDLGTLDESTVDPRIAPYLAAWRRFRADTGFVPTLIEERGYSREHGYGGTLDRVGEIANALSIVDIKIVAKLTPVTALQTAGYAQLVLEMRGAEVKHRYAVQLRGGDAQYRCERYRDDRGDRRVFLSLLQVYVWKVGRGL